LNAIIFVAAGFIPALKTLAIADLDGDKPHRYIDYRIFNMHLFFTDTSGTQP
jgi:hypothetical protein